MPIVALVAGLAGLLFQYATLGLRGRLRRVSRISKPVQLWLGALVMWAIGVLVMAETGRSGVFSLGYDDLSVALLGKMAWTVAAALLIGKLAGTVLCYGCGGCGGIFSPTLFFGGMAGTVIGGIASHFFALTAADRSLLAIGGMSACLAAVVQAPITALLIIFEMTHQFALVPGLMMAGLISLVLTKSIGRGNFYEEILVQDGHHLEHVVPPRDLRSWQNLPISAIANFQPSLVETLAPNELRTFLSGTVFQRFPVVEASILRGVLVRGEAEEALTESRAPKLEPALTAAPQMPIREAQQLLIASTTGLLVIAEKADGRPLGVVTLHDLLRAQAAMSERQG
jgi:CIC family chloride channel protein